MAPGPPGHASHFRSHGPLDLNRGGTPRSEGSAQNRPQRQPHLAVWSARAGPPTPAAPAVKLREDKAGAGSCRGHHGDHCLLLLKISSLWELYTKKQHFKISLSLSVNFDGKVMK